MSEEQASEFLKIFSANKAVAGKFKADFNSAVLKIGDENGYNFSGAELDQALAETKRATPEALLKDMAGEISYENYIKAYKECCRRLDIHCLERLENLVGGYYPFLRYGLQTDQYHVPEISLKFTYAGVTVPKARGTLLSLNGDTVITTAKAVLPNKKVNDISEAILNLNSNIAPPSWGLGMESSGNNMRLKVYLCTPDVLNSDSRALSQKLKQYTPFAEHLPDSPALPHGGVLDLACVEHSDRGWENAKLYFYHKEGMNSLPQHVINQTRVCRLSDLVQKYGISTGGVWLMNEYRHGKRAGQSLDARVNEVADPVCELGFKGDNILSEFAWVMKHAGFTLQILGVRFSQKGDLLCMYWRPRAAARNHEAVSGK